MADPYPNIPAVLREALRTPAFRRGRVAANDAWIVTDDELRRYGMRCMAAALRWADEYYGDPETGAVMRALGREATDG